MRALLRMLIWSLVLIYPGIWCAPAYQVLLLQIASLLSGADLGPSSDGQVDLGAANTLVLFLAMGLAHRPARGMPRALKLVIGAASLALVEVLTALLQIALTAPGQPGFLRAWAAALDAVRVLAPAAMWFVLFMLRPPVLDKRTNGTAPGKHRARQGPRLRSAA